MKQLLSGLSTLLLALVIAACSSVSPEVNPAATEASPPASAIIVPGESVGNVSFGETRASVEAKWGETDNFIGNYAIPSGGRVIVQYRDPDGGPLGTPDNVVARITVTDAPQYRTDLGVAAFEIDRDEVLELYPQARIAGGNILDTGITFQPVIFLCSVGCDPSSRITVRDASDLVD